MPQIAQQDYLRVSIDDFTAPTAEEKAEIRKHVQNNTIWDVIIENANSFMRVIAVAPPSKKITVYSPADGDFQYVDYGE